MELNANLRPPTQKPFASLEPSHLWVLGLAVDDDGSLVGAGSGPDSHWADCECPDNCPRDHENE